MCDHAPAGTSVDRRLAPQGWSHAEIIEEYPHDKYLPTFLLRGEVPEFVFHALVATDIKGDNIRVVTMYLPDSGQWDEGGRFRSAAR